MNITKRYLGLASSVLALSIATPSAAIAQTGQEEGATGIEEIVVTAQRRSESSLNVPISIQANSGEQLANRGIKQITDLQFITPGYNVSDNAGYTQVFIRGIGNAIFVGADPSVATFIDDVPRIYGSLVNNIVDVERVEVLKGAQGGLYGRNATGGVINIITRQPSTDEVKGKFSLSYGEKRTFEASGYINLPVTDKVALLVTGQRSSHRPYIKNIAPENPYSAANFPNGAFLPTGPGGAFAANTPDQTAAFFNSGVRVPDLNNQDFWATSAKLLVTPTENLKITLAADFSNKDDSNGSAQNNLTPAYSQAAAQGTLSSFGIDSVFPANFVAGTRKKFTVAMSGRNLVKLRDYGFSGIVTLSLPTFDLTSITAYRNQRTGLIDNELGATSIPLTAATVRIKKNYTYQEFRALSTFEGPLSLIAGASYLDTNFRGSTDVALLNPLLSFPASRASDKVKNWSIYGQAAYDLTDQLTLTASGRYIHEKNSALFPLSGTPFSATEEKFLPAATLSYKLEGGGNVYARWARGFKSGGINVVADIAAFNGALSSGSVFGGETVDTYEAGLRTNLFDRKVQATAAIFYNDYKNIQTGAHVNAANASTIILAIINAGSARTYGAEGTLSWRVSRPLTLSVTAGYLNAKYKSFRNTNTTILDPFDLSGTRMVNSPEFQGSFSANLDQPINDRFRLVGNLLVQRTSKVLFQVSGLPGVLPPAEDNGYWLTNARVGVRTSDDKYEFAIYANNLFNNAYTTYGNSNVSSSTQLIWGNPRIIGAEMTVRF